MNEKNNSADIAEKKEKQSDKLSIYEYEQKYVKRQNIRGAKIVLRLVAAVLGIFIFACLFFVVMRLYEIHEYAGYAGAGVALLIYIFLFIVPVVKIFKTDYFIVNVNAKTASAAKRHNKKVRHQISEKIIDLTAKVEGAGWYDSAVVGELAIALKAGNEKALMKSLTTLYNGSIKKSAKDLIFKSSFKSALYSALSQTNKVDAVLVAVMNLQLIKDLVFLYGFRPSEAKLLKIFARVVQNSLVAYGLGGVKLGNSIVKTMGDAVKGIPILGTAISVLVDSSVQGLTNGVLTAVIGYQTIKYLAEEYKLQEILDGIELADEEKELRETCEQLEKELKSTKKSPVAA